MQWQMNGSGMNIVIHTKCPSAWLAFFSNNFWADKKINEHMECEPFQRSNCINMQNTYVQPELSEQKKKNGALMIHELSISFHCFE